MKSTFVILLISILTLQSKAEVTEEAKQCFEWFDTLGFPDVKDATWAEVWTGDYLQPASGAINGG